MAISPKEVNLDDAPHELVVSVMEFWPEEEWENAQRISYAESGWDAFAVNDTRTQFAKCGQALRSINGVVTYAEVSYGYFQINGCGFPDWPWARFFNARHNAGTAHMLWEQAGNSWKPWYFSAKALGLL